MIKPSVGLTALALVVAACAEPGAGPTDDLTESTWELESGTLDDLPIPIIDSHPITLTFSENGVGGTAACNGYAGSYQISGAEISFSEISLTEMACVPDETMEAERMYLDAMVRIESFDSDDDLLTLTGDGTELVFAALPPVPISDLTGTVWVLDGLIEGDTVSSAMGERATLELFSDGSMLGSTGCRTLNGSYILNGAEVLINELAATGECPQELQDQDGLVVTVLGDGFRAIVEGGTLELSSIGDIGLIYSSED